MKLLFAASLAALSLAVAVVRAQDPVPQSAPPVSQAPQPSFADWVAAFRAEAKTKGISDATLDAAFANLTPDPTVLERERTQPELVQTLDAYVAQRLTTKTINTASEMLKKQAPLLYKINKAYGVPAQIMVAVWGMESNFGQIQGSRPLVTSLATLAYEGKRSLFRAELLQALTIVDRKMAKLEDLKGSWAGAMGQPQFMPSSYLKYAVDFDGDGSPNIWTSVDDVFASMANYLKAAGWVEGERWGREVNVPAEGWDAILQKIPLRTTGCRAKKEMTEARPLADWRALGVTFLGGVHPTASTMTASLVRGEHRAFLVYRNYDALIDYNCANSYAISVGLLSDLALANTK